MGKLIYEGYNDELCKKPGMDGLMCIAIGHTGGAGPGA